MPAPHLHALVKRRRIGPAVGQQIVPREQLAGFRLDGLADRLEPRRAALLGLVEIDHRGPRPLPAARGVDIEIVAARLERVGVRLELLAGRIALALERLARAERQAEQLGDPASTSPTTGSPLSSRRSRWCGNRRSRHRRRFRTAGAARRSARSAPRTSPASRKPRTMNSSSARVGTRWTPGIAARRAAGPSAPVRRRMRRSACRAGRSPRARHCSSSPCASAAARWSA